MPVAGAGSRFDNYLKGSGLAPVKTLPIWMVHGAKDASVPVSGADEFAAALLALGVNDFGYTRYPDAITAERPTAPLPI